MRLAAIRDWIVDHRRRIGAGVLFVAIFAWWCSTGVWKVGTGEQGVVLRFGRIARTCGPGMQITLPRPIETMRVVNTFKVLWMPLGFRVLDSIANIPPTDEESQWLTGDRYIVELQAQINYRIASPEKWLFKVAGGGHLRRIGECALTTMVAAMSVDEVLYSKKLEIQRDAERRIQELADEMSMGVEVISVILLGASPPQRLIDAFNELTNARAYYETAQEKARGEAAQKLPTVRAQSLQVCNDAHIYGEQVVNTAKAAANRFGKLSAEVAQAPEVLRRRLLLEVVRDYLSLPGIIVYPPEAQGGKIKIQQIRPPAAEDSR